MRTEDALLIVCLVIVGIALTHFVAHALDVLSLVRRLRRNAQLRQLR